MMGGLHHLHVLTIVIFSFAKGIFRVSQGLLKGLQTKRVSMRISKGFFNGVNTSHIILLGQKFYLSWLAEKGKVKIWKK